ncbi:MAG TPA: M56 family metallopeptidase [Chitinophagaceae bacterium]|nr:M56 family metallopeptidase [Chitinophagaceae bacterium]
MPAISQLNFLQSLGWALVNSLWQMALLWIIYKFILSFAVYLKAGNKTTLATFLIMCGFVWFLFTFISTLFFKVPGDLYNNKWIGLINENSQTLYLGKILSAGTAVYLILLVFPVSKFIRNYQYVKRIRNKGLSKISASWKIFVSHAAENLGILKKVQIWISDLVQSPVTIGFLKPVILIPVAAINQLTTQQLEAIILHELYHIRRYDYFINLIIHFIKTILYFNPFVILFVKTVEREREHSCDEMVIQFQFRPSDYAAALLLLGKNNQEQMLMAASGKNKDLLQRVETIMGISKKTKYSFRQLSGSLFTILFIIMMNVFFFANSNPERFSHLAFNSEVNPYYFLNSRTSEPARVQTEMISEKKLNREKNISSEFAGINLPGKPDIPEEKDALPFYHTVTHITPVLPELTREDELKLKETIGTTKKILEEKEWREIEKSSAEVFNSVEKERLKQVYQEEVNNIDWKKLEDQLRLSYEIINWNKVNDQLSASLAQIKLDSIQQQLTVAIDHLVKLEVWMQENKTTSIPDSDVSLKSIFENKLKAKAQLEKIKTARIKKVVKI